MLLLIENETAFFNFWGVEWCIGNAPKLYRKGWMTQTGGVKTYNTLFCLVVGGLKVQKWYKDVFSKAAAVKV